jgi:predicted dehydrogenase
LLALGERDIILYRTHHSTLPDDELSGFPVETDLFAALAHNPDAVIVSNPTALHLDVAIPAACRGCHLLIEKPLSHSLERVDELQEAVAQGGGEVLVGFQFRFHPGLQKVKELLGASPPIIGRPLSARAHWGEYLPNWHPWEDYRQAYSARADLGGGVILTLCHPLDYLRWFFGEVQAVWAFAERLGDLQIQVEDTAEIGLRFASGIIASVHLDYHQQPSAHYLEIIGTQGSIRWDNADGTVHVHTPQQQLTFPAPPGFERNDMFLAEMQHFLAVARRMAQPVCTLEDGLQALRLALFARRSATQGHLMLLGQVRDI